MDTRTGYTDGMTQRVPTGGALVRAVAYVRVSSDEQRREIARETRRGRRARTTKGEVVAGVVPFGLRFTPDRKNFEASELEWGRRSRA